MIKFIKCFAFFIILTCGTLINVSAQTACDGVECNTLPFSLCTPGGFEVSLVNFEPASNANSGMATYVYEICNPAEGVCSVDQTTPCLENDKCVNLGLGTCNRTCAVDDFHDLSHFDVLFPNLMDLQSCLTENTEISGSCACSVNNSGLCTTGDFSLGDGSCFPPGGDSESFVAKCDETDMQPGDCIQMTLVIAGETNGLGLGATIVVDKASTNCVENCLAGPSCEPCDTGNGDNACLTRTIGFWGTHPWITNNYDPVTVCGIQVGCDDLGSDVSACSAGNCHSITEALCSAPGRELKKNPVYVTLIRQLTAAKLNLNATEALSEGGMCADFEYEGKTIQEWIVMCEANYCDAKKSQISASGCIEALDAFNNSQDTGFNITPAPFDRPSVNDIGVVQGADPTQCHIAKGTGKNDKIVIGKKTKDANCKP